MKITAKILMILLVCSFFLLSGCEEVINVDLPSGKKRLVVEGWITDQPGPYVFHLSQSRTYSYSYNDTVQFEKKAEVYIEDDLGNIWNLWEYVEGVYITHPSVKGEVGRSYSIHIKTSDGREYASTPEQIRPSIKIDNIYSYTDKGDVNEKGISKASILIDFQEPPGEENYYLWFNYYNGGLGYGFGYLSDKYFNGQYIRRYTLFDSYEYISFQFKVQQFSISKEAYQFWSLLSIQTDEIGTQYDAPPTPIIGNIYNINDPEDYALGYFGAYGVSEAELK